MRARASVRPVSDVAYDNVVHEWHALMARHAAVHNALEAELRKHDIGVSEFEVLRRLAECDLGKCRGADLIDVTHLSQSAASRLVARMERDGLVERGMCDTDRRGIFVALTELGKKRYLEAKPTYRSVLAATIGLAATR